MDNAAWWDRFYTFHLSAAAPAAGDSSSESDCDSGGDARPSADGSAGQRECAGSCGGSPRCCAGEARDSTTAGGAGGSPAEKHESPRVALDATSGPAAAPSGPGACVADVGVEPVTQEWFMEAEETVRAVAPSVERFLARPGADGELLLHVGCGLSAVDAFLLRAWPQLAGRIVSVDNSEVAIGAQKERGTRGVRYALADATALPPCVVAPGSVGLVLDKGTLDTLLSQTDKAPGVALVSEMARVLSPGGECVFLSTYSAESRAPFVSPHFARVESSALDVSPLEMPEQGWTTLLSLGKPLH